MMIFIKKFQIYYNSYSTIILLTSFLSAWIKKKTFISPVSLSIYILLPSSSIILYVCNLLNNSKSLNQNTEYLNIAVQDPNLNLNEMINKTIKYMGDDKFYSYDAFDNNCEKFVKSILQANNLYNKIIYIKLFILIYLYNSFAHDKWDSGEGCQPL